MPSITGTNNTKAVVFDLISEGPITLVGGARGIYLNKTPLINSTTSPDSGISTVKINETVRVNADATVLTLDTSSLVVGDAFQDQATTNNKILVHRGTKGGTLAASSAVVHVAGEDQSTLTTSAAFFESAWLDIGGAIDFKPKIRITGGGLDGEDYVGVLISVTSSTVAVVKPKIPLKDGELSSLNGAAIGFDLKTTCDVSEPIKNDPDHPRSRYTISNFRDPITNTALQDTTNTKVSIENKSAAVETKISLSNFPGTTASFLGGGEAQSPPPSIPKVTSASTVSTFNTDLNQLASFFNSSRLDKFWGKKDLEFPDGAVGSGVAITKSNSDLGFTNNADDIDELIVTINFPSGLFTAPSGAFGAVFQIFFKYKTSASQTDFTTVQVFGPTTNEISNATTIIARGDNFGTFYEKGPPVNGEVEAASEIPIEFDFRFSIEDFKPFTEFQVEIVKVTPDRLKYDSGNQNFIADTKLKSITTIITDKLAYPFSGYAAIAFNSKTFAGEFPERSYHCRGIDVSIPKNYFTREEMTDGIARYTRDAITGEEQEDYQPWDGTFRRGYTDNPVWNLREILINKRWGLGHWVSEDDINDYSLYSLARYCDELVPDGRGNLEPRFTCGVYLTKPTEAYKVIKDFCSMMFALPYWVDGEFIIEGDRRGEPVYTFTKGNIIDGIFNYEGTGNKTRPNQIIVRFNDRDNFYEQDIELVDDVDDMITKNRIFSEEVVAFGATSRSQAIRYGKWKLLTSKLQKEVVSFKTGENAGFLKPGSIVAIQDADRNAVRNSGRIVSATTSTITLDKAVTLDTAQEHTLYVQADGAATYLAQESATISGTSYTRGDVISGVTTQEAAEALVDSATGEPVVVQFVPDMHLLRKTIASSSITGSPVSSITIETGGATQETTAFTTDWVTSSPELVWAIISTESGALVAGSAKNYRVLSISEDSPGTYGITAVEHFNSKFDILDEEYLSDLPLQIPRYIDVPPPRNFSGYSKKSSVSDFQASNEVNLVFSWEVPVDTDGSPYEEFAGYKITHIDPFGTIEVINISSGSTNHQIRTTTSGTHTIIIQTVSGFGPVSRPIFTTVSTDPKTGLTNVLDGLPLGGTITSPPKIQGDSLFIPDEYEFKTVAGKKTYVQADEPPDPIEGGVWYETDTGIQYIGVSQTDPPSWVAQTQAPDQVVVEPTEVSTSVITRTGTSDTIFSKVRYNYDGTVDILRSDGTTQELDVYDWVSPAPTVYTGLTFTTSGSGTLADFHVTKTDTAYYIHLQNGGSGYSVSDTLTVTGTQLDGATTTNDLTITVTGVNSGAITTATVAGTPTTVNANDYSIKATVLTSPVSPTAFSSDSDTRGSWLTLAESRIFGIETTSSSTTSGSTELEIALSDDGGTSTLAANNIQLTNTITAVTETVTLSGGNLYDFAAGNNQPSVTKLIVSSTGTVRAIITDGTTINYSDWLNPTQFAPGNYKVRASATLPNGTVRTGADFSTAGYTLTNGVSWTFTTQDPDTVLDLEPMVSPRASFTLTVEISDDSGNFPGTSTTFSVVQKGL
jgi:hypothetical protein